MHAELGIFSIPHAGSSLHVSVVSAAQCVFASGAHTVHPVGMALVGSPLKSDFQSTQPFRLSNSTTHALQSIVVVAVAVAASCCCPCVVHPAIVPGAVVINMPVGFPAPWAPAPWVPAPWVPAPWVPAPWVPAPCVVHPDIVLGAVVINVPVGFGTGWCPARRLRRVWGVALQHCFDKPHSGQSAYVKPPAWHFWEYSAAHRSPV